MCNSLIGAKGVDRIVTLASLKYHFIRENENLVQHPSNNMSICWEVKKIEGLDMDEKRRFSIVHPRYY